MINKSKKISRRKFIDLGVQGYAGVHLAHAIPAGLISISGCTTSDAKTFHGVCYHDCPDSCSWKVTVEDGKVTHFAGNADNPFTAGKLCGKMETFPEDITFNPDRILTPLKRIGKKGEGQFEQISWAQALKEVADKLKASVAGHGSESLLPFGYAGTQGLVQQNIMSKRFFTKLGASKLEGTICGSTAVTGSTMTNGKVTGILPEDIVHSRFIILWGTNTKHSNVHLWPYVLEARKQGAKIIVIDPFRSATAMEADQHIQLMPGTDVALALGMIHVIINEGLTDDDYIKNYTLGYDELKDHVQQYDPDTVASICGLEKSLIMDLARAYASSSPSLIRVLIGMEHNYNGGDAFRAVAMLPALTGAWREQGGGLLHMTYEFFGEALNFERYDMHNTLSVKEARTINMIQLGSALNDPELDPPVKTLFVFNANPLVTIPNQNLIRQGLQRQDLFTVVIEHFLTDTALYADYVFPATTQLEHWDVADSWGQIYVSLNHPAMEPLGESKPNSEFFRLLAKEMGFMDDCFNESDMELARSFFNTDHPYMKGITFDYLVEHGWARLKIPEPFLPYAEGNFSTNSGKCEFYNPELEAKGIAFPTYKSLPGIDKEQFPLQLLTIKSTKGFHNSSHANISHLIQAEGSPTLDISSEDASIRNIEDGDLVKVTNQYGTVISRARIRDRVRSGVVVIPQGFWPSMVEGNATSNALTNDLLSDHGRGAALQDCWVEVMKVT